MLYLIVFVGSLLKVLFSETKLLYNQKNSIYKHISKKLITMISYSSVS